jgi:dTDP-4-dehydrorhamnose reductase
MKVLIAGVTGMFGRALAGVLASSEGIEVRGASRPEFDITDPASVRRTLEAAGPDVVVNTAAYTAVDRAESESQLAFDVNSTGAGNLAGACKEAGARLVHISTDFVFDGKKGAPYLESDPTGPLNVYGRSKLEGELQVARILPGSIIVRTSWLYGSCGSNFVKSITRLAMEKDEIDVASDQVGGPTSAVDLAAAVLRLIDTDAEGIFHFSNSGQASWFEFAEEIVGVLRERGEALRVRSVRPVTSLDVPRPAVRPAYSVLDTSKYERATGSRPAPWREALRTFLDAETLETLLDDA